MLNLKELTTTNDPTYAVYLTMEEIMLAEEALFERSAVLAAIADMNVYKKDAEKGAVLDKKVIKIENIAKKIALPLDEMYLANEAIALV